MFDTRRLQSILLRDRCECTAEKFEGLLRYGPVSLDEHGVTSYRWTTPYISRTLGSTGKFELPSEFPTGKSLTPTDCCNGARKEFKIDGWSTWFQAVNNIMTKSVDVYLRTAV